jgi:hypothetical protein
MHSFKKDHNKMISKYFGAIMLASLTMIAACSGGGDSTPASTSNQVQQGQSTTLIANAGPDQSVFTGSTIALNGSKSINPSGGSLSYSWRLSKPVGSNAVLSDGKIVNPSFTADIAGTYEVTLIVSDGTQSSAPDDVFVLAAGTNPPPAANAGQDQVVVFGRTVILNGGGSSDANGDALIFRWELTGKPQGSVLSTGSILNRDTVAPVFTPDAIGQYTISLIVNDGTSDSPPDSLSITAENKPVPTADAGPDQAIAPVVSKPTEVTLNGSASHTNPAGDQLEYSWVIAPQGTSAQPVSSTGLTTANPKFIIAANQAGVYLATLKVTETNHPDPSRKTATDSVLVAIKPIANAGPDQTVPVGTTAVQLDGSASAGADITCNWDLQFTASGSVVSTITKSFRKNCKDTFPASSSAGTYLMTLTVTDQLKNTASDQVSIVTKAGPVIQTIVVPTFRSPYTDGVSVTSDLSLPLNNSWNFPTDRFLKVPIGARASATILQIDSTATCSWKSADLTVATVELKGTSCQNGASATIITPKKAGTSRVTLTIDAGAGFKAEQVFDVRVGSPPVISLQTVSASPSVCSLVTVNATVTGSNLVTPYTWTITPPPTRSRGGTFYTSRVNTSQIAVAMTGLLFGQPVASSKQISNPAFFTGATLGLNPSATFRPDLPGTFTIKLTINDTFGVTSEASLPLTSPALISTGPTGSTVLRSSRITACGACHKLSMWGDGTVTTGPDQSAQGLELFGKYDANLNEQPPPSSAYLSHGGPATLFTTRENLCALFQDFTQ